MADDDEEFDPVEDAYKDMVRTLARQWDRAKRWKKGYEPGDWVVKPEHFLEAWERLKAEDLPAVCERWTEAEEAARRERHEQMMEEERQMKEERKREQRKKTKARGITTKQDLIDQALEAQREEGII